MAVRRLKLVAAVVGLVGLGATAGFASSSFTDVEQDRYYTDAVEWAFDNGVTTGTSAATFSPEDPATRAQSVTFLHRYDENVVQPALDALDTLDELTCGATQVVINDNGWRCANLRLTRSGQFPPAVNSVFLAEGGVDTSVAIGLNGNPIISYHDWTTNDLELYVCADGNCLTGVSEVLVANTSPGSTSVTVGTDGNPLIAYHNGSDGHLDLYVCADELCTSGTNRTLLDDGSPGREASMALNADGNPVIAHFESDLDDLQLYVCDDPACASGTDRKLADIGSGSDTSVVVSADNNPVIAYVDDFDDDLMLYVCGDSACTSGTNRKIRDGGGPAVGDYTSVALGANGNPIIAHLDTWNDGTNISGLDLYVCGDAACTSGTNQKLVNVDGVDFSLVVGSDGNPIITYFDNDQDDLRVYVCADESCTTGVSHALDTGGNVGRYSSVAIGDDGNPVVSYYDADNEDLKVARAQFAVSGIVFD